MKLSTFGEGANQTCMYDTHLLGVSVYSTLTDSVWGGGMIEVREGATTPPSLRLVG